MSRFIFPGKIPLGFMYTLIFFSPPTKKKVSHILAGQAEEVQQYVKNGSRAIRGRVFPEYVCIEDVDKIISSVQWAPEEAAGRGESGKHLTASETRFTPIDRPTASAMNGKKTRFARHNTKAHKILERNIAYSIHTKIKSLLLKECKGNPRKTSDNFKMMINILVSVVLVDRQHL